MAKGQPPPAVVAVSWARVEPTRGDYDDGAVDALIATVRGSRAAGAEPLVVLHDGALPDWVIERHGWLDPDVLAAWGCYVDRVAQRAGVHVRRWVPIRGPFQEAGWYDREAAAVLRVLLDVHAIAYLHLHRCQGYGGGAPEVGTLATWGASPVGVLARVRRALGQRGEGADAWVRVLATGKLAPPFGLFGELPNGTPALDFIGMEWAGPDDGAAAALHRLGEWGTSVFRVGEP
ncbi:MAG: hypothetical protein EXR71_18195 [Myxococcales bacterium]|nr:hypothetical protein [Myxococcales bacterium]